MDGLRERVREIVSFLLSLFSDCVTTAWVEMIATMISKKFLLLLLYLLSSYLPYYFFFVFLRNQLFLYFPIVYSYPPSLLPSFPPTYLPPSLLSYLPPSLPSYLSYSLPKFFPSPFLLLLLSFYFIPSHYYFWD